MPGAQIPPGNQPPGPDLPPGSGTGAAPDPNTYVDVKGIRAFVVSDTFRYGIDDRGPTRTVKYQVVDRAADVGKTPADFCDALLGVGNFAVKPFGWPQPHRYTNNTALVCVRAEGEPVGARGPGDQLMRGEWAHITADYAIHQFDVYGTDHDATLPDLRDVPWTKLRTQAAFEEYLIDPAGFVNAEGDTPTKKIKKVVLHVDYIFTRSMIPVLADYDAILAELAGTVNAAEFMGKARGTLRIQPWDQTYDWDASGKRVQEFTMPFRWRQHDWNAELVSGTLDNWSIVTDPNGGFNYPYADYSPIVQYGTIPDPPSGGGGGGPFK